MTYKIGPIKAEIHSLSNVSAVIHYHDVLSTRIVEELKILTFDKPSRLFNTNGNYDPFSSFILRKVDTAMASNLSQVTMDLMSRITGYKKPAKHRQVDGHYVVYGPGAARGRHWDIDYGPFTTFASFVFYLSNVEKGGETAFPRLRVKITPEKGSMLLWVNSYSDGKVDKWIEHASCPVVFGEKWIFAPDAVEGDQYQLHCHLKRKIAQNLEEWFPLKSITNYGNKRLLNLILKELQENVSEKTVVQRSVEQKTFLQNPICAYKLILRLKFFIMGILKEGGRNPDFSINYLKSFITTTSKILPTFVADSYDSFSKVQRKDAEELVPRIVAQMCWKPNEITLDFGCGSGFVTKHVLLPNLEASCPDGNRSVIAVDISKKMVDFAATEYHHPNITYMTVDVMKDECEFICKFDKIFSFYVLHWITDQRKALKTLHSWMKPTGEIGLYFLSNAEFYSVYVAMSKKPDWAPYFQDVQNFIPQTFHSSDAGADISNMMTSLGFCILESTVLNRSFQFKCIEELMDNFMAVNPFTARIPSEMHTTYRNCLEMGYQTLLVRAKKC
ncbi:unnamed protein product [Allacma fusca]|uniref:Prolyl 4-hydroxylase alpha subunit domain-containing protein n=1 Tax=Allacma fusca TaxID=39272 RepID=A0A8J2LAP1_9HEXA|nr:unnamed protein product [Allacma fusca]